MLLSQYVERFHLVTYLRNSCTHMYVCTYVRTRHSQCSSFSQAAGEDPSELSTEVVQDDQTTPCVVLPEGGGVMAFITPAPLGTLQPVCPKCEVRVYKSGQMIHTYMRTEVFMYNVG